MTLLRRGLLALLVFALLLLAAVGLLTIVRGTPVSHVAAVGDEMPPPVGSGEFRRTIETLTGVDLEPGNDVEVLLDGIGTYPRLYADLRGARRSITLQVYYAQPSGVADTVAAILAERARSGVRVFFVYDAFGAQNLPAEYFERLRAAGVHVAALRPLRWYAVDTWSRRSHLRVVVVDGLVGYTGGFGLDDKWLGRGRRPGEWRETNVRFVGPAALRLQGAFVASWAEATGTLLTGDYLFPPPDLAPQGAQLAGLLFTSPTVGSTAAERYLALSIASARRTLFVANSYFVPDDDIRRLLVQAARRGVDVRVLTTSERTDVPTTWRAGRAHYEELLRGGVRIWEYQPSMMHAKTLVADGAWVGIGTLNFDNRSLALNDETVFVALDATLGEALERVFLADLAYSREIRLDTFLERPWTDRVLEWGASRLGRVL